MSSAAGAGGAWERLRSLPDRTPLRVKLITAVLALVAVALAVISIAGISILKSYLLNQADNQLQSLIDNSPHFRVGLGTAPGEAAIWIPDGGQQQPVITPVTSSGYGLNASPQIIPGPAIPASPSALPSSAGNATTVPATSGGGRWRIVGLAASGPASDGTSTQGTLVLAIDVSSVYGTIGRLAGLDLIVSGLLLGGILIVGIAVVRASLRPLTDIEQTAEAIAAGDLTRRVPDRDPRTEVGRLGRSLNAMLAQVETAFDARAASESAARRSEERMRQFVADASHELRTPLTAIRGYAEYYRQRGGLAEPPEAPAGHALANGADAPAEDAAAEDALAETAAAEVEAAGLGAEAAGLGAEAAGARAEAAGLATEAAGARAEAAGGGPGGPRASGPGHAADPVHAGALARPDMDRIMQRVEQESSRMGVMVEDMLLLARLDQQRPLDQQTVDMLTLAADAVHDARVVAPTRNISLTVGAGAALLVLGDEVRLRQVIGNLMSNALNHTPDGTPIEVRVRSGRLDEWRATAGRAAPAASVHDARPVPAVILEVADRGPGLTPYQAEHVFERFYRADQARTRGPGGAGLGLAIVSALVAAHGGNVWVESPPGGGATFHIAIPLAPEARPAEPDPDDTTGPDILNSRGA